tara:strand:- start:3172 stop:4887 length:1716 start_codon:yes stop_codon:yes gene_type:complete
MVEMSGSDALIEGLRREKVEAVFGMPGGANLPIYDSLYESGIRHVLVRHEQSAAHMADAYARVSRRAGVCMATSGPGATNLVTGIATAYMDSSPVIAITGQVPKTMIGRDAFQETDIMGVVASITKNSFQPLQSGDIPDAVKKAFFVATSGRPGPVVIDIPKDVQTDRAEMVFPEKVEIRGYKAHLALDHAEIERAAEILARAERPVLWGGGGVSISNASEQFQAIAELLMAPVITSLQGKGTFPEDHPLSLGPMGMHGRAESNKIVQECDALLAVGVRFSDRSTGTFSDFMPNGKIIHLDADPSEINKNKRVDVYVVGDAKQMLAEIYEALCRRFRQREAPYPWLDRVKEVREQLANIPAYAEAEHELSGPRIMKTLREVLPAKAIMTTGVGRHQMWAEIHYKVLKPRTWITSTGLGTMGFGLPAAIGAKVARPDVPVVDLDGDGSFMMTENALGTAVEEQIPITAIILNDHSLGLVEQWQRLFYNRRYIGVKYPRTPDFVKLAQAYEAEAIRVESLKDLSKALEDAIRSEVVNVIEVPVSAEEDVFPFMPPGMSLKDTIYGGRKETTIF